QEETMSLSRVVIVSIALTCSSQTCHAAQSQTATPADPKAFAAYEEGMRLLGSRWQKPPPSALERAEHLFQKAAVHGMPEGYYGLACVAYRSGDSNRASEAFANAKHAAELGLLEAKGLLVSYYANNFGTKEDGESW